MLENLKTFFLDLKTKCCANFLFDTKCSKKSFHMKAIITFYFQKKFLEVWFSGLSSYFMAKTSVISDCPFIRNLL